MAESFLSDPDIFAVIRGCLRPRPRAEVPLLHLLIAAAFAAFAGLLSAAMAIFGPPGLDPAVVHSEVCVWGLTKTTPTFINPSASVMVREKTTPLIRP